MRTLPTLPSSLVAIGFALALAPARAVAQADPACPTRAAWPTLGWPSRTDEIAAIHGDAIAALEAFAFTLTGADADRVGTRTDAVVVIHQGAIFYEHYARGFTPQMPHYTWSVTKTLTNALTGIAVGRGALALGDSICTHLALPRQDHCDVTVQNLIEFASGFDWIEEYENASNQSSSVLAMLYGVGHSDMARFVEGHPSRSAPGTTYEYSTGETTLLESIVDSVLEPAAGRDYPWTLLFDRVGIGSATLERDAAGHHVGGSYWYATPRDMAKFGFLYLNDGCWDGARILPAGWVHDSTQVSAPIRLDRLDADPGDVQGRQLWLNLPIPEQGQTTPWPDVPADAFAARGHWGQSITMIPSLDAVIVRVADDRDGTFDFNRFLSLALALLR